MPAARDRFAPYVPQLGCLALLLLLCVMPCIFVDAMQMALEKLHLNRTFATLAMIGIFLGGLVNVPLHRIERFEEQALPAAGIYSLMGWVPLRRTRTQTIIAANLGGCLVPVALVVYELLVLRWQAPRALGALFLASAVNVLVCYWVARPVQGLGITMPGFVSPLVAVGMSWLLLAQADASVRAPVAFVAGVLGPLLGADLLHLRDFTRVSAGMISIGGAGTFDGIVLSGLLAALLA